MVAIIVVMMAEAGLNARKVLAYMKWEEKMKKLALRKKIKKVERDV